MDSSMFIRLEEKVVRGLAASFLVVIALTILVTWAVIRPSEKHAKPQQSTQEYQAPPRCVWVREAHQATPEDGVPPNVKYNCWSSADGAWEGYVEEQQNGDWFNAHIPDAKTDEHADKYDTYGTLAQAQARVEQVWHGKVSQ